MTPPAPAPPPPGSYDGGMNPPKIERGVSATPVSPEPNLLFVILLFAGAVVIGAAIIYLGINGMIGGPIP